MRNALVLGLAVLLIVGAVGVVAAANTDESTPTPPSAPAQWRHQKGPEEAPLLGLALGLNQEQLDEINALRQEQCSALEQYHEQIAALQAEYKEALEADDADQLARVRDEFAALQEDIVELREEYQSRMLEVLTPEQQQLFASYRDQNEGLTFGPFAGFSRRGGLGQLRGGSQHRHFTPNGGPNNPNNGQTP